MASSMGKVVSVNAGGVREFDYGGRLARSAIWKSPVVGRIAARGVNLDGDQQADRKYDHRVRHAGGRDAVRARDQVVLPRRRSDVEGGAEII